MRQSEGVRRKAAKLAIMLMVWAIVGAVTGELVCRITGLGSWVVYTRGLYRAAAEPQLATELTPGFDGRSYGTRVKINQHGFRGDEIDKTPSNGTFRIACVGDSCTFGMGIEATDAWPAALPRRLSPPSGFSRVEVINAGVPGHNLQQYIESIRVRVLSFSPHVIIVGLIWNDLEPAFEVNDGYLCAPRKVHAPSIPGKRWFQTHSYFYQYLALKYGTLVSHMVGFEHMQKPRDPVLLQKMLTADRDGLAALKTLAEELRSKGVVIVVANLDIPADSPLFTIARDAGVPSCLVKLDHSEIIPDGHPDKRGHARIAEQVADVLSGKVQVEGDPLPAKIFCVRR